MEEVQTTARDTLFLTLGRCLVRAQAIELTLKRLLATRVIGGTVEDLEQQLAKQHADFATNTLGALVNEMLEHYLVSVSHGAKEAPDPPSGTHIYFRFESVVTMEDSRLLEMRTLFKGLVATRNDVVHNLAELFPLKTPEGCAEAQAFLASFETNLGKVWEELKGWAEAREKAARFTMSQEFNTYLVDGILPDGSVQWEISGIVRALRNAARESPAGDWTPLDEAIVWIRREAPRQIPSRYRCTTYRQAIHESGAFEVKRERGVDGKTAFLYRPKP